MTKAVRNDDSIFNPNNLNEPQIPKVQPTNNAPRWIQLSNEEALFNNKRIVQDIQDILESSVMGERRANNA